MTTSDRQPTAGDTIAAISTATGEAAIALVRVSGEGATAVADKIFRGHDSPSNFPANVQHLGQIVDESGTIIDQAMLSVHRAPASYTGEDLVEISCHGGSLVTARVLEACLRAGARPARPGEFTERAFINGKLDLTQAEAVIDLIRAKTDMALRSATEQLRGRLGQHIRELRDELVSVVAHISAAIDFPEEGISPDDNEKLAGRLARVEEKIHELLATADHGTILREGVRVVIYGATNAGKSSLLNRLVGFDRAIVNEIPGTTRDTVEEMISLRGIPVRLIDTAGLRLTSDAVEREGVARTEQSLETADLRLHLADGNAPNQNGAPASLSADGSELLVINKCDLPEHSDWRDVNALRISCTTGAGLAELEQRVLEHLRVSQINGESAIAINTRHRDCLRRALKACQDAHAALTRHVEPEYVALDLDEALRPLGEILGEVDREQILDSVFRQFCIGK